MSDIPIIIIPFRNRYQHLCEWLGRCRRRLPRRTVVLVVEQCDNQKFNRGAILNAGFVRAQQLGARRVIFHDVDLIPDNALIDMYTRPWPTPVVHFGARFTRYNNCKSYFGGVVGFDCYYFPGFSNLFYGWGGEDDSLYRRTQKQIISRPHVGAYDDLERYKSPVEKLRTLRVKDKCTNKRELLASDDARTDNYSTLRCLLRYGRKHGCEWLRVTLQKSGKCQTAARETRQKEQRQSCAAEQRDQRC